MEETRGRLLEAAIRVMAQRGYARFRVAEVGETAGVSRGGQIHHFPTKDSLVLAALDHVYAQIARDSRERLEALEGNPDIISALIDDARSFFFSSFFSIALDIQMAGGKDANLASAALAISADQRRPAERAWIERLGNAGIASDDAADLVWLVLSVVRGLAIRRLIGHDKDREDRVIALVSRLVDRHIQELLGH